MRTSLFLGFASLLLLGCQETPVADRPADRSDAGRTTVNRPDLDDKAPPARPPITGGDTGIPVLPSTTDSANEPVRPDNTAVNQRDRDGDKPLPTDQGNDQKDLDTTAEIRSKIVALSDISLNGRNVKIITNNGKVTLRGPVANENERKTIEKIAKEQAGPDNVTSELKVLP